MKKTKEQLKTEVICVTKRLQRLLIDIKEYYGADQRMVIAYVEGAINYLKTCLNNMM